MGVKTTPKSEGNGMGITRYTFATKRFVSTWVDGWSTGIVHMSGTYNEATKNDVA